MIYLAIDPGLKGGYAIQYDDKSIVAYPMPVIGNEIQVQEIVNEINSPQVKVIIEKVGAMPKQGVTSMFTFGKGFGQLIGMCQTMGWAYDFVTPQAWKKVVLSGTPKDKNAAVSFVSRTFPSISLIPEGCRKPHDGIADALCLLKYVLISK